MKPLALALIAAGAAVLVGGSVAVVRADHWILKSMPPGDFDASQAPTPPDYAQPEAWASLPELEDGADVFLPEHPPAEAPAAELFYLHPTTWMGSAWNGPIDDPLVHTNTERGGTLIQASAFNACCRIWGPHYRQAHGLAFTEPSAEGHLARDLAYSDVEAAFEHFLEQIGERPFLLAGHSQGSMMGSRLLRERVAGTELEERLVAAYLLGGSIGEEDTGLPTCASAEQTGCLVAWNSRGPRYRINGLEMDHADPETLRRRVCVNPLSWDDPERHAPAEDNAGALFFDTPEPEVKPAFADAQCVEGALVLTEHGELERDGPSKVLLWMMGPDNFHPIEVQLYYLDLRANAVARTEAWLRERASPPSPPPSPGAEPSAEPPPDATR